MPQTLADVGGGLGEIARRIEQEQETIALRMLDRFRAEIVDYAKASEELLYDEVLVMIRFNLAAFVANLGTGATLHPDELDRMRQGVTRRVHQGVSLAAVSQAYHLFGEMLWEAILEDAETERDKDAVIRAAGHLMRHVRTLWAACAQAYLDEAEGIWTDRHVLHRDLLEAVLRGHAAAPETRREARALGIDLEDDYAVLVARPRDRGESTAKRHRLRSALEVARGSLRSAAGPPLTGLRDGELVALVPLTKGPVRAALAEPADRFASTTKDFVVGVGGWHPTPSGVPLAYAEAREAADAAIRDEFRDRAVHFEDIVLTHVVNASPAATGVLRELLDTLTSYDARRNSELVHTLHAFVEARFSVPRSAERLIVHPNTVTYRLRRIHELTGRDPRDPDDLVTLCLALKLERL